MEVSDTNKNRSINFALGKRNKSQSLFITNSISIDGEHRGENKLRVLEYGTDFFYPIGIL